MNNLAIITARSGSKRLPDKNIKELNGIPLMAYSIQAALKSGKFSHVMVSTDSPLYAEIAKKHGAEVPFLRNDATSGDTASSWDTLREVVRNYKEMGLEFDTVTLLQPTSPLRSAEDIIGAFDMYQEKNATAIVSCCPMEHIPLAANLLSEDGCMNGFLNRLQTYPRETWRSFYRINGSIYIVDTELLMSGASIYNERSFAYIMSNERSVDIDTELDFVIAEAVMNEILK